MIEVKDTIQEIPICPHCEKELQTVNCTKLKAEFGVRFIYFCANCKKVLGFSHRKGFWMG
jgi:uncharacterized protein with PIN domain